VINVENKGTIRKLTARFLKAGRTRNIIAVIAIALTSVMFTSVFTIGGNMLAVIQDQTMRQVGTSAHGGFKYLTREQYENFTRSPLIKDIAYRLDFATAENEPLMKVYTEISYAEDKLASWHFSLPTSGRMPRADGEAATSTIVLDALGVPHKIGAEVPLEFTVGGVKHREVFILCGYWTGDSAIMAQNVYLSEEYIEKTLAENVTPEDEQIEGTISADVWFGNSFNVENKLLRLIEERGYADGEINFGVNWAYAASGEIDPATAAIMALVLILILLSGYLIIYSVFAISVKTDIHFYGLLKTIGTTGTQLRRIVRGQAFALSAFGIPIGLLLGYISGVWLTPALLNTMSVYTVRVNSASPLIFIFAAVFSLLTVFIGCRKPGKIAARVSPVEAVRYSGVLGGGSKKEKKTRKVTPLFMAWSNVTREKRKLCVIVLSLSLALILLNGAFSASRSFDIDAYLSGSIISDFAVVDASMLNNAVFRKETESVTQDFLDELAALGVTETGCVYFHNYIHKLTPRAIENLKAQFEADRALLERYYRQSVPSFEQNIKDGLLPTQIYGVGQLTLASFYPDYGKLSSGNYALSLTYGWHPIYEAGDIITLTNKDEENRDFEIIGMVEEYPYSISARFIYIPDQKIILADNVFADFFAPPAAMQVNFNVDDERLPEIESWLAEYTATINPFLGYISRNTLKAEFESLQTTYLTMGGAMAFILALIGVLNFINTVVASIIARRREFAMLQSVGMTGKQLRETLFYEGMCYAIMTFLFTFTAGVGVSRLIVRVMAGQTWFFKEYLTIMPSVYCVVPLLVICAVVPLICYRWMARESLVERLRVE